MSLLVGLFFVASSALGDDADNLIKSSQDKRAKGDVEGALADLNKAIAVNPVNAMAYNERGTLHLQLTFTKAQRIHANQINANDMNVAVANDLADLTKAIELKPDFAEALFHRATLERRYGHDDSAMEDLSKIIELNSDSVVLLDAYTQRGILRRGKHDFGGAMADFSRIIELKPDSVRVSDALMQRGMSRTGWHDFNGALADLNEAVKLCPSNTAACNTRSLLLVNFDNCDSEFSRVQNRH